MSTITYRNHFIIDRGYRFVHVTDDFMTPSVENGEIGELRWAFANGTVNIVPTEQNHPGIIQLSTGAVCGTRALITIPDISISTFSFTGDFVVRPLGVTSVAYRVGMLRTVGAVSESSLGFYFSFDSLKSSTWRAVTRTISGVSVTELSTPVIASAWYHLGIARGFGDGKISFLVNGAVCAIHSEFTVTTLNFSDGFVVENLEPETKLLDVDFFERKTVFNGVRY